jgi:hypothetical protein
MIGGPFERLKATDTTRHPESQEGAYMRALIGCAVVALIAGCDSSSNNTGGDMSVGGGGEDMAMTLTTTIASARASNMTTPITVMAVVTGVRGDDPADTKEWYIEDPAGGPNSGVAVYCNKTAKSNPCPMAITAPALNDLVQVTGTLSTYKGRMELDPSAEMTVMANATPPPVAIVMAADLAANGTSMLRGTVVKIATKLTVDDVTPSVLYDKNCEADGGVGTLCTTCAPPTYSGFQLNDGASHELLIENYFFASEHLANSPECLTAMGAIPVTKGQTFSSVQGILDYDTNGSVQALYPVTDQNYVTP